MAYEATKVELTNDTGFPRRFTVASTATITKGTVLKLSDPRTAAATSAAGDIPIGIASMDKSPTDDDSTSITVWTDGIFEMRASSAIPAGDECVICAPGNTIASAGDGTSSSALVIGYALETAAANEIINVRVRV